MGPSLFKYLCTIHFLKILRYTYTYQKVRLIYFIMWNIINTLIIPIYSYVKLENELIKTNL